MRTTVDKKLKLLFIDILKNLIVSDSNGHDIGDIGDIDKCCIEISTDRSIVIISVNQFREQVWGSRLPYVYILQQRKNKWLIVQRISAPVSKRDNNFGCALALSSKYNTIFISASCDDNEDTLATGAVHVYEPQSGHDTPWKLITTLTADDLDDGDMFGSSLYLSDDENTLCVGAPMHRVSNITMAGTVYVYTREKTGWLYKCQLAQDIPVVNGFFGYNLNSYCSTNGFGEWAGTYNFNNNNELINFKMILI